LSTKTSNKEESSKIKTKQNKKKERAPTLAVIFSFFFFFSLSLFYFQEKNRKIEIGRGRGCSTRSTSWQRKGRWGTSGWLPIGRRSFPRPKSFRLISPMLSVGSSLLLPFYPLLFFFSRPFPAQPPNNMQCKSKPQKPQWLYAFPGSCFSE